MSAINLLELLKQIEDELAIHGDGPVYFQDHNGYYRVDGIFLRDKKNIWDEYGTILDDKVDKFFTITSDDI